MIKRYKRLNQKGITLVELLAVLAILSFTIVTITGIQYQFLDTVQVINKASSDNDQITYFQNLFSKQVRDSSKIFTSNNGIRLIDSSGMQYEFNYDRTQYTITYVDPNLGSFIVLQHVTSFSASSVSTSGRSGVELILTIELGTQTFTYDFVTYSHL